MQGPQVGGVRHCHLFVHTGALPGWLERKSEKWRMTTRN